jgi:hypothetical protein
LLSLLAGLRSVATRRLALVLCAAIAFSLSLVVAPAGAIVTTVGPAKVGLQPRSTTLSVGTGAEPETFANPGGGVVLPASNTYAIYWDPTYHYHNDWENVIDTFFQSMGTGSGSLASVFAVDTQYTDAVNQHALYKSTFMGAYTDTDPYPKVGNCVDPHPLEGESYPKKEPNAISCLTNAQIQQELEVFIANHGLQKGMSTIYYLLTPPGVTVCLQKEGEGGKANHCSDHTGSIKETGTESYKNSFCSYHSDVSPTNTVIGDERTILYGVVPWIAGGFGDGHLGGAGQASAYDCQDGGFNPSSEPIEEKEEAKVNAIAEEGKRLEEEAKKRAAAEAEESKKQTTYEESFKKGLISKAELEEKELELKAEKKARIEREAEEEKKAAKAEKEAREKKERLEGPHQQEPNQVSCPSPDGYCDTGLADLIINQVGVEQQNIVTNPLLNAWQDAAKNEATDECRNFFASGSITGGVAASEETVAGTLANQSLNGHGYYLNTAFNLAALKLPYPGIPCLGGVNLVPQFTAPNPVNRGEIVGFDGMESEISLNWGTAYSGSWLTPSPKSTYATYKWDFGDKTPEVTGFAPGAPSANSPETSPCAFPWEAPCAASTFHSYKYGGTYNVTLTVIDTGGNKASVTNQITVAGEPEPQPSSNNPGPGSSPAAGPAAAGGSSSSSGSGSSGTGSTVKPIPGPVATAAAVSHSLRSVLKKGLVISYSVNEQVAGQFQVLLASSIARRIGLHGASATGLPQGTPPQTVIAKAILITTRGGRNTVKILFGKKTAAKLRKLHKVTLMIRLVVRNASSHSPLSTTVLSTVTLSH